MADREERGCDGSTAQKSWKERAEKYREMEEKWEAGGREGLWVVSEICREASVPALEAGLLALVPLARENALAEHTEEVGNLAMKQVSSNKPTTKKAIREIIGGLAQTNPQKIVESAIGQIRDKNHKVISETLKVLEEESGRLSGHLLERIVGHTEFLFAHGAGGVREEATRLYQRLGREDERRIREATKNLKPIQIKEIFQGGAGGSSGASVSGSGGGGGSVGGVVVGVNGNTNKSPSVSAGKSGSVSGNTGKIATAGISGKESGTHPNGKDYVKADVVGDEKIRTRSAEGMGAVHKTGGNGISSHGVPGQLHHNKPPQSLQHAQRPLDGQGLKKVSQSAKSGEVVNSSKQKKETGLKIVKLPADFFERINSAVWKERLVMEELDGALGTPQSGTLSKEESNATIHLIMKRISENNNKVFIASMSVLKKLAVSQNLAGQVVKEIVKTVGKRLKDKNTLVYQSAVHLVVEMYRRYRLPALEEAAGLLAAEKTSRIRVLQALDEIVKETTEEEIEKSDVLRHLIEATKDPAAEVRSSACAVMGQVLAKTSRGVGHAEIEKLGVERILASRIEEVVQECVRKKEEEVEEIVDTLCEDIRNTTINTTINNSPSTVMTPIRKAQNGGHGDAWKDAEEITNSPVITHVRDSPFGMEGDGMEEGGRAERSFIFGKTSRDEKDAGEEERRRSLPKDAVRSSLALFVEEGKIEQSEIEGIIEMIGQDPVKDARIVSVLQHISVSETDGVRIKDKIEELSYELSPQAKVSVETIKSRITKKLYEKSIFEEKCVFAALMERVSSGDDVQEEEVLHALDKQMERGNILQEEDARRIIRRAAESRYLRVAEKLDSVFPISKTLSYCVQISKEVPEVLNIILLLVERCKLLPHFSASEHLGGEGFIEFLEERARMRGGGVAEQILEAARGGAREEDGKSSPYIKRIKQQRVEEVDVNTLLNEIIDQDSSKSRGSLERLEKVSRENMGLLLGSASTLVNVLLLQMNDALSLGVIFCPNAELILKILKRACGAERFLGVLDGGTLLGLVSDMVAVVTGQGGRSLPAPEAVRKESGETLIKICTNGPSAGVFKVYMTLLCNGYREEKLREVLVKLIWKHSKVFAGHVGDRKVVLGIISSLNAFYAGFRGDLKSDPLISKVLQLHLIEMLKHYGEEFAETFKVTGAVLQQARTLGTSGGRRERGAEEEM